MSLSKRFIPNVRRQSMEVLNDDCVGLILSYLSLRDKFRLERVSKQWQRKIFLYVNRVKIAMNYSYPIKVGEGSSSSLLMKIPTEKSQKVLKMVFAKCENIEFVEFERIGFTWDKWNPRDIKNVLDSCENKTIRNEPDIESVLALIANDCHGLSHFKLSIRLSLLSSEVFEHFFSVCGHKLKKLELDHHIWHFGSVLSPCVNLEEIVTNRTNHYKDLFQGEQGFFPRKLQAIDGEINPEDITSPLFAIFCEKYKNSMKRIKLLIIGITTKSQLFHLLHLLNEFNKLEFVSLRLWMRELLSGSEWNEVKQMNLWSKVNELEISGTSMRD